MTGTGRDTIVPSTPTDTAATVSATHGVGAASTAEVDGIMAILATTPMVTADTDTAITMVTDTATMMEYTPVTITTTTTATDHSHTDTSTVVGLTTAKPMTATTTEATVPTWLATTAAWVVATIPTVHTLTTMAAVSMRALTAEDQLPAAPSAKDMRTL